jgi:uncharacterized protein
MIELFKEIIREFHQSRLPEPVRRAISLPALPKGVRKAFVFIGMRRSGKTYTLYQIMQDLIAEGLDFSKILYINFEDERLADMKKENFQDILKAYFSLYPEYIDRSDIYFFFDEIHEVDGWEKFIRRLIDQEAVKIYITGSSAKMLSKEIASSMRGRTVVTEVFPFNFTEMLEKEVIVIPRIIGGKSKLQLMHHLENFLRWGGFPEVIGGTPEYHRATLQEYMSTVLYRDIVERYNVSATHALRSLLNHCLRNSATLFSITKMHHSLKSLGYEIGKNTLYDYMDYFEDAYCIFSVSKYDLSQRKAAGAVKKIFAVDQGLITAVSMSSNFDLAAQLETAVFAFLRRTTSEIFYYRTIDGKEVDFFALMPDQTMHLFQVCLTMKDPKTRQREISALVTAMEELKLIQGTIITLDEEDEVIVPQGTITIMPLLTLFIEHGK